MKSKAGKIILIGIAAVVVILQFFRGSPPEVILENRDDLIVNYEISEELANTLKAACYDCHSNETKYPWYSYITPVSWFVFDHIEHGREELNFSDWAGLRKSRRVRKLKDISEEVADGEMPLRSYLIMHGEAKLTEEQRQLIADWTESFAKETMDE